MPKLVLITEITGQDKKEVREKLEQMRVSIVGFGYKTRIVYGKGADKYWRIRHESFNLLRKHVRGRKTAPFIDDVIVPVETLPQFLPNLIRILDREKIVYTIAGHAGNGNFHIIPLMDLKQPGTREKIMKITDEVYSLVLMLGGSLTAEHGDGIMRTPYLPQI